MNLRLLFEFRQVKLWVKNVHHNKKKNTCNSSAQCGFTLLQCHFLSQCSTCFSHFTCRASLFPFLGPFWAHLKPETSPSNTKTPTSFSSTHSLIVKKKKKPWIMQPSDAFVALGTTRSRPFFFRSRGRSCVSLWPYYSSTHAECFKKPSVRLSSFYRFIERDRRLRVVKPCSHYPNSTITVRVQCSSCRCSFGGGRFRLQFLDISHSRSPFFPRGISLVLFSATAWSLLFLFSKGEMRILFIHFTLDFRKGKNTK